MGVRMMDLLSGNLDALRYEPTAKRIRVSLGGEPVADTRDARLVWEPRRVVPTYAVPLAALSGQLVPAGAESGADEDVGVRLPAISSRPILDPTVPFDAHSCAGTAFDVHRRRRDRRRRRVPARRPRPRRLRHPRVQRVRVAGGGRADRQPSARSVRPDRRAAQQPAHPRRSRRPATCRVVAADAAVRDPAAGALLSASRGRRRPARTTATR